MGNYLISCDWLQIYGQSPTNIDNVTGFEGTEYQYDLKKESYATPIWKSVYTITARDREVAVVCNGPRITGMNPYGVSVKLANRVLYAANWRRVLLDVLRGLSIEYLGITRLDLCYDCNELADGTEVHEFLYDYVTHAPYCTGHIIRSGSRCMEMTATRGSNGAMRISALRWGKKTSDIGAYCYNKSLELLQVKDKPWIRECWERAGLVNVWKKEQWDELTKQEKARVSAIGDAETFVERPVWRFEVSIKGHGKDLIDLQTGNLFKVGLSELDEENALQEMFHIYAKKVLDFRRSAGASQIRYYKKLDIFENVPRETTCRPVRVNMFADTGRTEKIVINCLDRLSRTYSDLSAIGMEHIQKVISFLKVISFNKSEKVRQQKDEAVLNHMRGYKFLWDEFKDFARMLTMPYVYDAYYNAPSEYTEADSLYFAVCRENIHDYYSEAHPCYELAE